MQRNWGEISLINKTLDKTDNCEPKRKNSETRLTAKLFTWTISSKCFWRFEYWTNNTRVSCSSFKSFTAQMRYYRTKSSWMSKVFSFCWLICWKIEKNVQIFQEWKRRKRIWAISKITARRSTVCRCCRPFAKHFEIYFVPFFCLNKKESNKSFAWRLIDGVSSGGMLRLRRRLGMRRMTTTATSWTPRGMDRFTASCSSRRQSTNSVACSAEIIIKNCARVV